VHVVEHRVGGLPEASGVDAREYDAPGKLPRPEARRERDERVDLVRGELGADQAREERLDAGDVPGAKAEGGQARTRRPKPARGAELPVRCSVCGAAWSVPYEAVPGGRTFEPLSVACAACRLPRHAGSSGGSGRSPGGVG
jgi:hypothetical protein